MRTVRIFLAAPLLAVAACGAHEASDDLPDTVVDYTATDPADGSSTSTTAYRDEPCDRTVTRLGSGEPLGASIDLFAMANGNDLAPLPIPGAEDAVISDRVSYSTREEFVGAITLDDPTQRFEDLGTAGFERGLDIRLQFGPDTYGVIVMELGSPEQAAAYRSQHLLQLCGRAAEMREMANVEGGAAFYRRDTNAARAVFVLGRYEVNLDICTCVEVADRLALAEKWASAIVRDLSAA